MRTLPSTLNHSVLFDAMVLCHANTCNACEANSKVDMLLHVLPLAQLCQSRQDPDPSLYRAAVMLLTSPAHVRSHRETRYPKQCCKCMPFVLTAE